MTLRDDLRGVRKLDLACAVAIVPIAIWAGAVALAPAQDAGETQVPAQETQVQDAGDAYTDTWAWCQQRFPYRADLQEACRWGAYEMLPGQDTEPAIPLVPTYERKSTDA